MTFASLDARGHRRSPVHRARSAPCPGRTISSSSLYQPTVDLRTGAVAGVEALLRWRHPERGIVQPDDFIPALESSGLIVPVGEWVLHEACRQARDLDPSGATGSPCRSTSRRCSSSGTGSWTMSTTHSPPAGSTRRKLILELTETTLMLDVDATLVRLKLLKALGVNLAIDDFGTGYSSLAYLRQFPDRRPEDRPILRVRDDRDQGIGRHRSHPRPTGQGARTDDRRRRHRRLMGSGR